MMKNDEAQPPPPYNPPAADVEPTPTGVFITPQSLPLPAQGATATPGMTPMTTVTMGQPAIHGFHPMHIVCPHCSANITTEVHYKIGARAMWLAAGLCIIGLVAAGLLALLGVFFFICFFCVPLPCLTCNLFCWLPLVLNKARDVHHHCPNCNQWLGQAKR